MPNRLLTLLLFVALGLLAGCGSTRHSLGRPAEEIAVVRGSDYNVLQLLGVNSLISIRSIDGQDLKQGGMTGYPDEVEVLPGHHQLGIYYSFQIDSSPGPSGEPTLEFDAIAGKTYQLREQFMSGGGVTFVFDEVVAP